MKKTGAWIIATVAIAVLLTEIRYLRPPADEDRVVHRTDMASSTAADPTFDDLVNVLKTAQPTTVAQYLFALQQRYPKYFQAYTLGYHSRSLQHSTYESPRAIVFGDKGDVILAFNGDPTLAGYGSIETLTFDPQEGPLFQEMAFLGEPHHDTMDAEDIEQQFSTAQVKVSKPNISRCGDCHGYVDAHINWDPYFNWPGFYGSNDDNAFRGLEDLGGTGTVRTRMIPYLSVERNSTLPPGPDPEHEGLVNFAKKLEPPNAQNRYSVLSYLPNTFGENCDGYGDKYNVQKGETCRIAVEQQSAFWENKELPQTGGDWADARPNLALSRLLFSHVGTFYAHEVMQNEDLRKYRFALAAAYSCWAGERDVAPVDETVSKALPAPLIKWHTKQAGTPSALADQFAQASTQLRDLLSTRLAKDFHSDQVYALGHELPEHYFYAMVEFITKPYGLSIYDIANNPEGLPAFFIGGDQGFESSFAQALAANWLAGDGYKVSDFFPRSPTNHATCYRLLADSRKALQ